MTNLDYIHQMESDELEDFLLNVFMDGVFSASGDYFIFDYSEAWINDKLDREYWDGLERPDNVEELNERAKSV